jgi:large subunit ribosomal protein L31
LRFTAFRRGLAPIATPYGDDLVHRLTSRTQTQEKEMNMKKDIHPEYKDTQVTCGCGEKFVTRSTVASGSIYVEVCSVCHPFYTGKQRILDTGGRVAKFEERFGKKK